MNQRDDNPQRACEGKVGYPTMSAAERAIEVLRNKRGWKGMGAYKCKTCPKFHIGHQRGNGSKARYRQQRRRKYRRERRQRQREERR